MVESDEGSVVCPQWTDAEEPQVLRLRYDAARLRFAQDDNAMGANSETNSLRKKARLNGAPGKTSVRPSLCGEYSLSFASFFRC